MTPVEPPGAVVTVLLILGALVAVHRVRRTWRVRGRLAALRGGRPARRAPRWPEHIGAAEAGPPDGLLGGAATGPPGGASTGPSETAAPSGPRRVPSEGPPRAGPPGDETAPAGRAWPRPLRLRPLRSRAATVDPNLPLAAELLAACLAAGATPGAAASAVGACLDGPLGAGLRSTAAELRMGGEPARAWARLGRLPGAADLARRLELAHFRGGPAVAAVAAEATACRDRRRRVGQERSRRAAVYVTGPLGLCFLPAFLLVGVAPVIIGLVRELL